MAISYNFYERKDELTSRDQLDWIEENIEGISSREQVLFVFQAEFEAVLFTNIGVHFPKRTTKRSIAFKEVVGVRIAGHEHVELRTTDAQIYTIVLASAIDKVKIFQVLQLLIKNDRDSRHTSFEEVDAVFRKFTVLKYPLKQMQHKLPQVYLKQFGFQDKEQWKVSIVQKGEQFARRKSIGSFTAETNIFDIESEDDRFPRMFETLNADLENLYPQVLSDITTNTDLSDASWEILVQLTPNLMVRSDYWREFVSQILNSGQKETFLDITLSVHTGSYAELTELKNKYFYRILADSEISRSTLNKVLLHLLNYVSHHLRNLDVVIIKAPEGQQFFTSDNPVVFNPNQVKGRLGLFSIDTEVYLPLSKDYLAYFHSSGSKRNFALGQLKNRGIYEAQDALTQKEYDHIIGNEIMGNSHKLIILPGTMEWKSRKVQGV